MRRLVEAVEGQASRAKADQAARDADRERETRAVGAVFWALFGLAWLASEQQASISHFVTSNWGALPVLIPLFGIVAAFAYRAFRLRVFTVSLVFTVVAMVVLTEVYFMRGSNEVWARTLNVFLAYTGLYYFLSAGNLMTDDEASGEAVNSFVKRRPRVAIGVLVLLTVLALWYILAPMSPASLGLVAVFLAGGFVLVILQRALLPRLTRVLPKLRKPPEGG